MGIQRAQDGEQFFAPSLPLGESYVVEQATFNNWLGFAELQVRSGQPLLVQSELESVAHNPDRVLYLQYRESTQSIVRSTEESYRRGLELYFGDAVVDYVISHEKPLIYAGIRGSKYRFLSRMCDEVDQEIQALSVMRDAHSGQNYSEYGIATLMSHGPYSPVKTALLRIISQPAELLGKESLGVVGVHPNSRTKIKQDIAQKQLAVLLSNNEVETLRSITNLAWHDTHARLKFWQFHLDQFNKGVPYRQIPDGAYDKVRTLRKAIKRIVISKDEVIDVARELHQPHINFDEILTQ